MSDIPNLNGLVELARRKGVDIQPTLLRVMTDLYVQKPTHSAEEDQQFTELALRLIDVVDEPTRAVVTERIASHPGAPQAVRLRLLRGQIALSASNSTARPNGRAFCSQPQHSLRTERIVLFRQIPRSGG